MAIVSFIVFRFTLYLSQVVIKELDKKYKKRKVTKRHMTTVAYAINSCYVALSVASKKVLHCANVCFSVHAIAQPCRCTKSEAFQA